ncbi:MAG: hypothetical protein A3H93_05800 [Rhodocyclales bacterium RIFCSPLOWO2_02_FULL_63_24]|nr:MAG: hypothetical protein A3H93_05800 [Rhodocyclales bacterium RIFCSPLOWO2_02_FULL_63_24]
MFERVILLLLQGEFICAVSHPDEYRFLEDERDRDEVVRYLGRLNRRLTQTPHQSGYYLAFSHLGDAERESVKGHFQDLKGSLGPVVLFFQLVMRTTSQEDLLMPGALLETSSIMSKIDQDAGLRNELQNVALISRATATDGAYRTMFDKLLGKLKTDGYLTLANAERGLYQVTSKMEYLLDVVRFLQENDPALSKPQVSEEEELAGTRPLL